MKSFVLSFTISMLSASALATPLIHSKAPGLQPDSLVPRQAVQVPCDNGPTSRKCWGDYSIDTDYYRTAPNTRRVSEHWLSVQEGECNQDGVKRYCQTFNGTIPGPLITANWGDEVVIHVTNNMQTNGTSIHWHGLHMKNAVEYDGVPGVTQCPIPPGKTLTYKFRATQYGSTWYHSHFSLQYADGLFGPMIFNGPTSADYHEDLGVLFLNDWFHESAWRGWSTLGSKGRLVPPPNGLVNGSNTFDCGKAARGVNCVGGGKKFAANFKAGKKHLLRLINSSNDAHFQFSIDGHTLQVVANDLVPIKPYTTDSILIAIGQRYDVIVEANATPGDYWLRSGFACTPNDGVGAEVTGIIRYDPASTADPKSESIVKLLGDCGDESVEKLQPWLEVDVTNAVAMQNTKLDTNPDRNAPWFQWTLNSSSLVLDWHDPTLEKIFDKETIFPTRYNVVKADRTNTDDKVREWYVLVMKNDASTIPADHPIHLHGHDFWILSQKRTVWDGTTDGFNFKNPPRRDTATLPRGGHLAIAFELDNPGAWLIHCHIAWHASQGLSLEFVESQARIAVDMPDHDVFRQMCRDWDAVPHLHHSGDSGI